MTSSILIIMISDVVSTALSCNTVTALQQNASLSAVGI